MKATLYLTLDGTAMLTTEQRLAIRAAQRGNWKPADSLELDYLAFRVKPHDADGEPCVFKALKPVGIMRHCGPRGEDVVEWEFDTRCAECAGTGWVGPEEEPDFFGLCVECDGEGFIFSEGQLLTDIHGLILEDDLP